MLVDVQGETAWTFGYKAMMLHVDAYFEAFVQA